MKYLVISIALLFAGSIAMGVDWDGNLVGKKVMVTTWHAKLTDDGKELDAPVAFGDIFTVGKIDGHLLWVKRGWIDDSFVMTSDKVIASLTEKINADKFDGSSYHDRAHAYAALGELDKAIEDENHAIWLYARSPPRNLAIAYNSRGLIWLKKDKIDSAIRDFNRTIEYQSDFELAFNNRGIANRRIGNYQAALSDFGEAIRLNPSDSHPYGNRAWIWATCPDPKFRDGAKAVESATRGCELSSWRSANRLDDLAAAYAEEGDFSTAIKWEAKAIDFDLESFSFKNSKDFPIRLEMYMRGKPFRDQPKVNSEKSNTEGNEGSNAAK